MTNPICYVLSSSRRASLLLTRFMSCLHEELELLRIYFRLLIYILRPLRPLQLAMHKMILFIIIIGHFLSITVHAMIPASSRPPYSITSIYVVFIYLYMSHA